MDAKQNNSKKISRSFDSQITHDLIRFGNNFVNDFIFDKGQITDIPINALRVIFNIINIISNEQFRPEDRPKQLTLFDDEYQTENNTFVSMKIKNSKISPSGSSKQVTDAYEFLTKYKMGWYKSINQKGNEIKTFGGLISSPSYDQRGYTTFLISSYWLQKLVVIPEYNYILYNLVYNIPNNKHILFAIWLNKIPNTGIELKLATFNDKFLLHYKTSNDLCKLFLKPLRANLDKYNDLSFNYKNNNGTVIIMPYNTKTIQDVQLDKSTQQKIEIRYRLSYFKKRFKLEKQDMSNFIYQYKKVPQTKEYIETAYKIFVTKTRKRNEKTTIYEGKEFLKQIQEIIIELYQNSKTGQTVPNGYPVIL